MKTAVPHQTYRADISEALSYGWNKMKAHLGFFIGMTLLQMFLVILSEVLLAISIQYSIVLVCILYILYIVLILLFRLGTIRISLSAADEKPLSICMLFSQYQYLLRYLGASLLYSLLITSMAGFFIVLAMVVGSMTSVAAGMAIGVVGGLTGIGFGIYWGLKYSQFYFLMLDEELNIMDSFRKSAQIMKGHNLELFALYIVLSCVNLLGILLLGIGLLFTIPITLMAYVHFYRAIKGLPPTEKPAYVSPTSKV